MDSQMIKLTITINNVELIQPSNFFLRVRITAPATTKNRFHNTNQRTDVACGSSRPTFKTKTFHFDLPENTLEVCNVVVDVYEVIPSTLSKPGKAIPVAMGNMDQKVFFKDLKEDNTFEHEIIFYKHVEQPKEGKEKFGHCQVLLSLRSPENLEPKPNRRSSTSRNTLTFDVTRVIPERYTLPNVRKLIKDMDLGPGPYRFLIRPHGVSNLVKPANVFLVAKSTIDAAKNRPAKASTQYSIQPVRNMVFHETLIVKFDENEMKEEEHAGLFLALVDYTSKEYLAKCIIQVDDIIPGEQYNFAMEFNEKGTQLLLSLMMLRSPHLQMKLFQSVLDTHRIEVFLHGLNIANTGHTKSLTILPKVPFVASVQIVDDISQYQQKIQNKSPTLPMYLVHSSLNSKNFVPSNIKLAFPCLPINTWNSVFEFITSSETFEKSGSALVLEIFKMDYSSEQIAEITYFGYAFVSLSSFTRVSIRDGDVVHESAPLRLYKPDNESSSLNVEMEIRRWSSSSYVNKLTPEEMYRMNLGGRSPQLSPSDVPSGFNQFRSTTSNPSSPSVPRMSLQPYRRPSLPVIMSPGVPVASDNRSLTPQRQVKDPEYQIDHPVEIPNLINDTNKYFFRFPLEGDNSMRPTSIPKTRGRKESVQLSSTKEWDSLEYDNLDYQHDKEPSSTSRNSESEGDDSFNASTPYYTPKSSYLTFSNREKLRSGRKIQIDNEQEEELWKKKYNELQQNLNDVIQVVVQYNRKIVLKEKENETLKNEIELASNENKYLRQFLFQSNECEVPVEVSNLSKEEILHNYEMLLSKYIKLSSEKNPDFEETTNRSKSKSVPGRRTLSDDTYMCTDNKKIWNEIEDIKKKVDEIQEVIDHQVEHAQISLRRSRKGNSQITKSRKRYH